MRIAFIGKLIKSGTITPAEGRLLEGLLCTAVSYLATYGYEWISSSVGMAKLGGFAPVATAVIAPVLLSLAKSARDAEKSACQ